MLRRITCRFVRIVLIRQFLSTSRFLRTFLIGRLLSVIATSIMSAERITDVYKKVKKVRRRLKEAKARVSEDTVCRNVALPKNNPSDLQVLKEFDLALEFGPCAGITRLERWERAFKHGLDPPVCVKDILMKHQDRKQYNHCLWNDYDI